MMFSIRSILSCLTVLLTISGALASENANHRYKICVPHIFFRNCLDLLKEPSQAGLLMDCVPGRDRMDCLEKVNIREADLIAVDPEDMYVAYHMNNQDFQVISEIRTQAEKDAEFRYEGVILVKKSSDIHSLDDLQGKKSCHTGYGRNVGFRIPITKLKKHEVLKVPEDPPTSSAERELKALSQFFSKSCIVGNYSSNPDVDLLLKKRYSNLCEICEHPEQCNYPDKFSGYDGAIRCLDQGQGDVAFTKTSFVKKYFGLIPGVTAENTKADDFEYLCEDGSRHPITAGPVCSWAQRPWQGYMTNTDTVNETEQLRLLQQRVDSFYNNGKQTFNKAAAATLLIKDDLLLHEKPNAIMPKEYLERAGYKDVIERDGSMTQKIRFCVETEIEVHKCQTLKQAAYSRDIRPEFECQQDSKANCIKRVSEKKSDVVILSAEEYRFGRAENLKPLIYESFKEDDVLVAAVDTNFNSDKLQTAPIKFNARKFRERYAVQLLNKNRNSPYCPGQLASSKPTAPIEIISAKNLSKLSNKQLLCSNLQRKSITEFSTCNVEGGLPNAVFVRENLTENEKDNTVHAFATLSTKFGHTGNNIEDVFEMFDEFQKGEKNVLFHDSAVEFVTEFKQRNELNESLFNELQCL